MEEGVPPTACWSIVRDESLEGSKVADGVNGTLEEYLPATTVPLLGVIYMYDKISIQKRNLQS